MTADSALQEFDALVVDATEVEIAPDQAAIEETLLTAIFASPEAADLVLRSSPNAFQFEDHRVFAGLTWPALRAGDHVDLITFRATLPEADAKDPRLGRSLTTAARADLLALAVRVFRRAEEAPPSLDQAAAYARIFEDRAKVALAKNLAGQVVARLDRGDLTPTQAAAQIAQVEADLEVGARLVGDVKSEGDQWGDYVAGLRAYQNPARNFQGLDSGFDHLNNVANGLTEGLFILGAAPSTGKTTFAKQLADQVAELNSGEGQTRRAAVVFVSLEQSAGELRVKTLARMSGIENRDILRGRLDVKSPGWAKVRQAATDFARGAADRLFVIEGDRSTTVDRIRLHALQARRLTGAEVVFVVVDYLQIIPTEEKHTDPRARVDATVSDLRRLARDLKSPIMAVSAISRSSYEKPGLASFRESSGIEYGADTGAVMTRSKDKESGRSEFVSQPRAWKLVNLDLVKNRNGEKARIALRFFPEVSAFEEESKNGLPEDDPSE